MLFAPRALFLHVQSVDRPSDQLSLDEIKSTLGEGTFGKVVECVDRKSNKRMALKIIKNIEKYR
eukprot:m.23915 g.23915  ORF g.23915 m.23915 type:complete len:64 (+) comp28548_c0_seq4:1326-1517(+)